MLPGLIRMLETKAQGILSAIGEGGAKPQVFFCDNRARISVGSQVSNKQTY